MNVYSQENGCIKYTYLHDSIKSIERKLHKYHLTEPHLLKHIIENDFKTTDLTIVTSRSILEYEWVDSCSTTIYTLTIDSINTIPDDIKLLKKLRRLEIHGNGLISISPSISSIKRLKELCIHNLGRGSPIQTDVLMMSGIKKLEILASDSMTVINTIKAIPTAREITIYYEAKNQEQLNWNTEKIFYPCKDVRYIYIQLFDASKYLVRLDSIYDKDIDSTFYINKNIIDFDLRQCKKLRTIKTNYELSEEMQKYCRKNGIRVVKFTRTSLWERLNIAKYQRQQRRNARRHQKEEDHPNKIFKWEKKRICQQVLKY